jgi:RimJ/RimL family protein N-acetyltransferase
VRIVLKKCVVRSWKWSDAAALRRHADNRHVWRNLYDGFPSPYTLTAARRWLAHCLSQKPETSFAIEVDGECIGGTGIVLKEGPALRTAEVGYWIGETYWGRGITADAVRGLTAYVFEKFPEIVRLYAQVFEWNTASMRVLEKAGYTRECTMPKSAVKAGEVIDLIQYALIREESAKD